VSIDMRLLFLIVQASTVGSILKGVGPRVGIYPAGKGKSVGID